MITTKVPLRLMTLEVNLQCWKAHFTNGHQYQVDAEYLSKRPQTHQLMLCSGM